MQVLLCTLRWTQDGKLNRFFKMTIGDKSQFDGLMDQAAYKSFCDGL